MGGKNRQRGVGKDNVAIEVFQCKRSVNRLDFGNEKENWGQRLDVSPFSFPQIPLSHDDPDTGHHLSFPRAKPRGCLKTHLLIY